ncbi:MAG: HAD-IA family hydrolase [Chloroflexaceae bacterium]|nr:HAD-IA family hydrolase [Chloroflexaceae bacterium]
MTKPQVIFLDVVGTLIEVYPSVGAVYGELARQAGVIISHEALNAAFFASFKAAPPPWVKTTDPDRLPQQEFRWWQAIAESTFARLDLSDNFGDFGQFFAGLYAYFATEKPWYVYPDVAPTLQFWREQDIELGIISNFDTRLYAVLERLHLREFFQSITLSFEVGAAKPDSHIFRAALQKHDCLPSQAWHIGDSLKADYQGAKHCGLQAFLIQRSPIGVD